MYLVRPNPALLAEIDKLVRQLIPCLLDAAGLKTQANQLRSAQPIANRQAVIYVCKILKSINEGPLVDLRDPSWELEVRDVAFWSEAAIWSAVSNLELECTHSVGYARLYMDGVWMRCVDH